MSKINQLKISGMAMCFYENIGNAFKDVDINNTCPIDLKEVDLTDMFTALLLASNCFIQI